MTNSTIFDPAELNDENVEDAGHGPLFKDKGSAGHHSATAHAAQPLLNGQPQATSAPAFAYIVAPKASASFSAPPPATSFNEAPQAPASNNDLYDTPVDGSDLYDQQGAVTGSASTAGSSVVAVTNGGMTFDLIFDAAAMAAPASFRAGIEQAASILSSYIKNKITVNLKIDYSGTGGGAAAGPDSGYYVGLSTVDSLLAKVATPGDKTFSSLPTGTSTQGQSQVAVWDAQMKALGLINANDTTTDDGAAYFATDINPNLLVGVALHELTHALGRVPFGSAPDIFDLFRYTAPGVRLFSGGATAPASYFSLDGGVTKLADFGQKSDPSDFLNSGVQGANDPFNEYYSPSTSQVLSSVDLQMIHALGYQVGTPTPPPPTPDLTIGPLTVVGTTINWTLSNIGTGSAAASTTGLYLTSAAAPTTASTLLGTVNAAALAAGASQAESLSLTLPANLAAGTYNIAAIADTKSVVAESNESNNVSGVATVIVGSGNADTISGTNAIMYGLAGNDTLKSTGGNNVFIGGAGNDTLVGGTGNDQFVYTATTDGLDQIQNFHLGDYVDFSAQAFGGKLAVGGGQSGVLDASHFIANATGALNAAQEFWFNTSNQTLYYSPLGATTANKPVAIAHLQNTYVLHSTDIQLV